jgi:DNA-binding winged helix-turn-helix (wHTH) protein/DNA-binding NarL/FixJ family response regulator
MIFAFDDHELDERLFELRRAGAKEPGQPRVLDTLLLLVRHRDRVVLKTEMLEALWPGVAVSDASIARAIMDARKAIGDELQQKIMTVRARGFRFSADVTEIEARSSAPTIVATSDPTFVGREACLTALEARLEAACAGRGSAVWLSGEPGIGKTRTVDELARRARARGALVCSARAEEQLGAPPFWLWTQIVRARGSERLAERASPLFAGAAPSAEVQFATFDAVVRELVESARARPLVLVLDDLQWADDGSLALLQFLARAIGESAIVIVGAYRDTESAERRSPRLIALASESGSYVIALRGLAQGEIQRFVELATGSTPSRAFADALLARAGGNPRFLHQLLQTDWAEKSLTHTALELATSMDLNKEVVDSIARHVRALSERTRDLLTESAVLGRQFDLGKLAIVSAAPQGELLDRLEEAVNARVLRRSTNGVYFFAHALVRDVLYKTLTAAERAERHRRVAEKLLAHYQEAADAHAAELAYHFSRALPGGDPARAFAFAMRAAEQQTLLGAHEQAIKHWSEAIRALGFARGETTRRLAAQLGLAHAHAQMGRVDEARSEFLDAAILARSLGSAEDLAEAALGFASSSDAQPSKQTVDLLAEAAGTLTGRVGDRAASLREQVARVRAPQVEKKPPAEHAADVELSPRMKDTLEQLLTGAADKEIAERLGLSVHTVREYVKSVLHAFGVNSRAELIARVSAPSGRQALSAR